MKAFKSERHHWWPMSVSSRWRGADGYVSCIRHGEDDFRSLPKNLGVIRGAHQIKLSEDPSGSTPWDENFEHVFGRADNWFPAVIDALEELVFEDRRGAGMAQRFVPQRFDAVEIGQVVECVVSLAVRSPRTREAAVSVAEALRGPRPTKERELLIAANLRHMHETAVRSLGSRGKLVAIRCADREFIFGDGFFHSLLSVQTPPMTCKIVVPVTPNLCLLYCIPSAYRPDPQLFTLQISADEADFINESVQIYSAKTLFYRTDRPRLLAAFREGRHLRYRSEDNPIEDLLLSVPGNQSGQFFGSFPRVQSHWWRRE